MLVCIGVAVAVGAAIVLVGVAGGTEVDASLGNGVFVGEDVASAADVVGVAVFTKVAVGVALAAAVLVAVGSGVGVEVAIAVGGMTGVAVGIELTSSNRKSSIQ